MHEHARSLPFPILDIQLLVQLHALGYHAVKVVSNRSERPKVVSNRSERPV